MNISLNRDDLDQMLRDGAELHITTPDTAYIQIGTARYYFLGVARHEEVKLFSGDKVTKTILPYDGWEKTINQS